MEEISDLMHNRYAETKNYISTPKIACNLNARLTKKKKNNNNNI